MSYFMRIILIVLVFFVGFWLWQRMNTEVAPGFSLGQTVADVVEEQGRTVAPDEFVSETGIVLRVTSPLQDSIITSPLTITGEAPGTWYFEASFPIVIVDWDGLIIAQGHADAQADWMTEDFVPFIATLEFEVPLLAKKGAGKVDDGTLILQRDNPSGLSENDDAVEIPIRFE